ncbi:MAG: hypothetical protein H6938_02905 [Burkholderiales bacterium]|nr:hypothetical protein [Burkholderiales bacterium]
MRTENAIKKISSSLPHRQLRKNLSITPAVRAQAAEKMTSELLADWQKYS